MELYIEIEKVFPILKEALSKKELRAFAGCRYGKLSNYHFGFGTWVRNNLLHEDGDLYKAFCEAGYANKDEMSAEIIRQFYLHIKKISLMDKSKLQ